MSDTKNHPGKIMLEQLDQNMASLQSRYDAEEREALEIYSRLLVDELLASSPFTDDVAKALDRVFNRSAPIMPMDPMARNLPYYQQISQRASRNDGELFMQAFNKELALRGLNLIITRPHRNWYMIIAKKNR